jgi:hypothetical protein
MVFTKEDSRDSIILGRISDPGAVNAYKSYSFESGNTMRNAVKHASSLLKYPREPAGGSGLARTNFFKEDL